MSSHWKLHLILKWDRVGKSRNFISVRGLAIKSKTAGPEEAGKGKKIGIHYLDQDFSQIHIGPCQSGAITGYQP